MKFTRIVVLLQFLCLFGLAQPAAYSPGQAHSHNDYEQPAPFWMAWRQGFGSIEVDIFLEAGRLLVAHDRAQIALRRSLDSLYLQPVLECLTKNKGRPYPTGSLQVLVDIKTAAVPTIQALISLVEQYPALTQSPALKWVITGNQPPESSWQHYPAWLQFDGAFDKKYDAASLARVALFSANFARFSRWNGKGRIPEAEAMQLKAAINKAHQQGKPVRFWNAPDLLNSWNAYIDLGIDWINTDQVNALGDFLRQLPLRSYQQKTPGTLYEPRYRNDGSTGKVKNVILLIGDGTGLAQWYAGYTANHAALNVFGMRHTGFSKTSSADSYITDSAPGSTAFSAGVKTRNRSVGVDTLGKALPLLPEWMAQRGIISGLLTTGDIRDATPADFYAHQSERSNYAGILRDLLQSPVQLLMGTATLSDDAGVQDLLQQRFTIHNGLESFAHSGKLPALVLDTLAGKARSAGRGNWSLRAFEQAIARLSGHGKGFFLMMEGAQIDHGGHANDLPYLVTELLDFDECVGAAMRFADQNGETLVLVTADHETGGLSLTGGDYKTGLVRGAFSTTDHTAIPVPVFAYGPGAQLFSGVYENTAIHAKIKAALLQSAKQ